jgi:hypothetical protein
VPRLIRRGVNLSFVRKHKEIGHYRLAGAHRLALFIHRAVRLIILRVADLAAALPVKGASWRAGVDG